MSTWITREAALELIKAQKPEANLIQHAIASEAVMRALAQHFGEPEAMVELWALTGLLHDVDYPHTKDNPAEHGLKAEQFLQGHLPDEAIFAIKAHNSECTGVEPQSKFDLALRASETVTGLISAAAMVRPNGMQGMEAKSLKKKMKDKAFAASVSRERIKECEKINMSLDEFLNVAIKAMSELPSN